MAWSNFGIRYRLAFCCFISFIYLMILKEILLECLKNNSNSNKCAFNCLIFALLQTWRTFGGLYRIRVFLWFLESKQQFSRNLECRAARTLVVSTVPLLQRQSGDRGHLHFKTNLLPFFHFYLESGRSPPPPFPSPSLQLS